MVLSSEVSEYSCYLFHKGISLPRCLGLSEHGEFYFGQCSIPPLLYTFDLLYVILCWTPETKIMFDKKKWNQNSKAVA